MDFGARINDPRLGRWLSIDPLAHKFPWQSTYASMDNNPIYKIDPTGMAATPPDEITLNDKGEVSKVVVDDNKNTFFDEKGNVLNVNDPISDDELMWKEFKIGDKVYEPISRKEMQKVLDDAGKIDFLESVKDPVEFYLFPLAFPIKYAYASYTKYDFTYTYILKEKVTVTPEQLVEMYYESGYVDGIPFLRFEGNNTLYNVPDAGNFMWGKKAHDNHLPKDVMLKAVNFYEMGSDSPADTRAILSGYNF